MIKKQHSNYFWTLSILILVLFSISSISFISAANPVVIIQRPASSTTGTVNLNVNDSTFWQGYIPSTLPHNILAGLQGGSSGQYYHFNQSYYNKIINNAFLWITGANVAYTNQSNNFTGDQIIHGNLDVNGSITGTFNGAIGNITLADYIPYVNATNNADLGIYNLTAANLLIPTNGTLDFRADNISNDSYMRFNPTSHRIELWANGKLQQDWGNSTTIYGTATFEANAFFTNLSGTQLLISSDVLINGTLIVSKNATIDNVFAGNICYSDGSNCTYINGSLGNLTQQILALNQTLIAIQGNITDLYLIKLNATDQIYNDTAMIQSVNTTTNIMSLGFYNSTYIDTIIPHTSFAYFLNKTGPLGGTLLLSSTTQPNRTQTYSFGFSGVGNQMLLNFSTNNISTVSQISLGTITFFIDAIQTGGTKTSDLKFSAYRYNSTGDKLLICNTSRTSTIPAVQTGMIGVCVNPRNIPMTNSDKVYVEIWSTVSGSGSSPTISLFVEDNTDAGIALPIVLISQFTISGTGTKNTIPIWTSSNTLGDSPIQSLVTDEAYMTIYNGTFYIDNTNKVAGVNIIPGEESHVQAFQVNTFNTTGVGTLTSISYNSTTNLTLVTNSQNLSEGITDATNIYVEANTYYIFQWINITSFYVSGNAIINTATWSWQQAPYIDINGPQDLERGLSISESGQWKWAMKTSGYTNSTDLCFQQSGLYYKGTTNAMCLDVTSGKSILKNNGAGAFIDYLYIGNQANGQGLSNITTKAGMFLPKKYVGVDSSGGDDAGFVFGYNNNPVYDWSTFIAEQGKYLHLINYQSGGDALTIGNTGRIGVNKPSNVMNYHNAFNGTGANDMYVGGTYTGGFNDGIEVNVTSAANPNQFSYRITIQNGVASTVGSWSTPQSMNTSAITIYKGITLRWDSVTGHVVGNNWHFNAFPANPTGTFTVKPTIYEEVSYYNGSTYNDLTFASATSSIGSLTNNPFTIFGTTGKYLYVGRFVKFASSEFALSVPATGLNLKVEYWNGAAWTNLNATNSLTDGTVNLTKTGPINWDSTTLTDWQTNVTVDTYNSTTGFYWIRYSTTSTGTAPTIDSLTPQAIDRIAVYQAGFDISPVFSIEPNGDTVISGTLKANGFYGEMYNTSTGTLTLGNANIWSNITGMASGELSGWTINNTGVSETLVCSQSGLYTVTYTINAALNANDLSSYRVMINDVQELKGDVNYKYVTGASQVISSTFLRRFNSSDRLYLQFTDTATNNKVLTMDNRNIIVTRIGN